MIEVWRRQYSVRKRPEVSSGATPASRITHLNQKPNTAKA